MEPVVLRQTEWVKMSANESSLMKYVPCGE